MRRAFLSFNLENDHHFVSEVHQYLKRQPDLEEVFFYDERRHAHSFHQKIGVALQNTTDFVFFRGTNIGIYQTQEALEWVRLHGTDDGYHRLVVELPDPAPWPPDLSLSCGC